MKNARYRHHQTRHNNRTSSALLIGSPPLPVTPPRKTASTRPALSLGDSPEPLAVSNEVEIAPAARPATPPLSKRQARRAAAKAARKQHKVAMRATVAPAIPETPIAIETVEAEPTRIETPREEPIVVAEAPSEPIAIAPLPPSEDPQPLPRSRALSVHRSRGALTVIGSWTRTAMRTITPQWTRRDRSTRAQLAALRGQVETLQASIDRLTDRIAA